jgi:hypothetical protein
LPDDLPDEPENRDGRTAGAGSRPDGGPGGECEELVARYVSGEELTDAECGRLLSAFESDPELRRRLTMLDTVNRYLPFCLAGPEEVRERRKVALRCCFSWAVPMMSARLGPGGLPQGTRRCLGPVLRSRGSSFRKTGRSARRMATPNGARRGRGHASLAGTG